jgi:biofilm PGA synthesis N-glycosyltransferase PgaC
MNDYIAITPARDEERMLPGLIASMIAQTVKPKRWIIINDGSADRTAEIIEAAAHRAPWIEPRHLASDQPRAAGGESVVAQFLSGGKWLDCDAVLRLDADLSFDPRFAELLIAEFQRNPKLGIASATLLEPDGGGWREVVAPSFHTRGAVKMYSLRCLEALGAIRPELGWDTLDEVGAMMRGFETRNFRHIRAYHHRPQGAAGGLWKSRRAAGEAAYNVGYSPIFLAARAVKLLFGWPPGIAAAALLAGYVGAYLRRKPRPATPEMVAFVRRHQMRRLTLRESLWR